MATAGEQRSNTGKYVAVYGCILLTAALQFLVAYSDVDSGQMAIRMLLLAFVEAILAILFFMHLWMDSRGLLWSVAILIAFVIFGLQYGWSDSYRLLHGVPWAK
jgi:caa(3)-type oxidase subunit IV